MAEKLLDSNVRYLLLRSNLLGAHTSKLEDNISRYDGASTIKKFFWKINPFNHYDLEAKVSREIKEERDKNYAKWRRSVGRGKIC